MNITLQEEIITSYLSDDLATLDDADVREQSK